MNIFNVNKTLKGIALILFGILLCISSGELNATILHSFSYFPFSLLGVIAGVVGMVMIFVEDKDRKDK